MLVHVYKINMEILTMLRTDSRGWKSTNRCFVVVVPVYLLASVLLVAQRTIFTSISELCNAIFNIMKIIKYLAVVPSNLSFENRDLVEPGWITQ